MREPEPRTLGPGYELALRALLVLLALSGLSATGFCSARASVPGHRGDERNRAARHFNARRALRAAGAGDGRDGAGHATASRSDGRRPGRPVGPIPAWFAFALRNCHRQAGRALDCGRPLQHRGFGRGLARPRRAARREDRAFGRLCARAHQERPGRRVPHHAGARPDRHLRRRAGFRPFRAHLSLGPARLSSSAAGTGSCSTASCWTSPACWRSS